jgi:hypothetical protein
MSCHVNNFGIFDNLKLVKKSALIWFLNIINNFKVRVQKRKKNIVNYYASSYQKYNLLCNVLSSNKIKIKNMFSCDTEVGYLNEKK